MSETVSLLVSLGFAIVLFLLFIIRFYYSMRKLCDKSLDKQIELGNKVYCAYTVKDSRTKEHLIYGEEYRSVNGLILTRAFYKGLRKIYVYEFNSNINGVDCIITIFANVPGDEPIKMIEPAGEKLLNEEDNIFTF